MRKILVVGGTGTMGTELVDLLAEDRETEVHVVSRSRSVSGTGVSYHKGDAMDANFMSTVLSVHYDAIVDFMVYSPDRFKILLPPLLAATEQYVSLSSSAVIANSKNPLDENSPRFLDIVPPSEVTGAYHFKKAQTEDILKAASSRNWTIVRPHVTFGKLRIPLCTYEMDIWLYRAVHGLPIAIPKDILSRLTTLTYCRETAWQIKQLIGNRKALGEIFQVGSDVVHTWGSVLDTCMSVLKEKGFTMKTVLVDSTAIMRRIPYMESNFKCNRYFDHSFSFKKLRSVIGPSEPDFGSLRENISKCLDVSIPIYKDMKLGMDKSWLYASHDKIIGCWTPLSCFSKRGAVYYMLLRLGLPISVAKLPFLLSRKSKAVLRRMFRIGGIWTRLSNLWENIRFAKRVFACKRRYAKVVRRIRRKPADEKIRVLFIVNEIAKFKCGKLFEEMRDSGIFDPIIALSAWNQQSFLTDDQLEEEFEQAERFFNKLGYNHVRTVRTHPRICSDLSEFKPDVVFYSEPWAPCGRQDSESVSRFALTCFVPYYVPNYGDFFVESQQPVHKFLFRYFTLPFWAGYFRRKSRWWDHSSKFVPAGHPALDFFAQKRDRKPEKNYIVFAPHHSIKHPKVSMPWFLSTFDWTGRPILEYAKRHPEQNWVFKPHPVLRKTIVDSETMTQEEADAYYAEWERIGIACYDSDYQDLFLESRAIITDSGSFLTEAGATGRPVIRLISPNNTLTPLPPSKKVYDTYYEVRTLPEMYELFKTVLEDGEDPKRNERLAAVEESGIAKMEASKNIMDHLRNLLGR